MLDCFTQSRAFPQTTPPSLCILHTLSTKQNTPLISSTTSRLKSPRGDFTQKHQLPDGIRLSVTRVLTPIGYIALQFDSGGGAQQCFLSSSLVFVSRSRLSLVVCLGDDNASSVVGARASASLVSSLSLSSCVSPLSSQAREGRALPRRSAPRFVWLSVIHGDPTKDILVSRSVD